MKEEISPGNFCHLCNSCEGKNCCVSFAAPVVLAKDYEKLHLLDLPDASFLNKIEVNGQTIRVIQQKPKSTTCLFFDEQKMACSIYDYRPLDCRMYPFEILQIKDRLFWVVHRCNPGSSWQWLEEHLLALEQDPNFEELLDKMALYQAYTPPYAKSFTFTILREVRYPS